jgi:hypothetical protein
VARRARCSGKGLASLRGRHLALSDVSSEVDRFAVGLAEQRRRGGELAYLRCPERRADYEVPARIHVLEALPRRATERIAKHLLREP